MQHEILLQYIIDQIKDTQGVRAIVLGGSYASNSQRPDSDIDIGLYYFEENPLDVEGIRLAAQSLNDFADPTVTDLGGWGTWVNGGAWLTIQGQRVDFLYRSLDFVTTTIEDCLNGKILSDYWQQPAYGFHSFMYCTETFICQPLHDPDQLIAHLKARVAQYPPQLKKAVIQKFLWSARFTLDNTYKPAARGEIYLTTGALARTIHCLVQVLYAINGVYYLSEKKLATDVAAFPIKPANFLERINTLLGSTGTDSHQLQDSIARAEDLYRQIALLGEDSLTQANKHTNPFRK